MAIYRGCSLFQNGIEISDTVNYSPPELSVEVGWFKAGAMNSAVPVDLGTKEMTASYKITGFSAAAYIGFGFIPGVKTRLTVRRAYRGPDGVGFLEDEVEGFISSIRPDDHGGDNRHDVGQVMTICADFYKLTLDGYLPLIEINPVLGLRKIYGVNVLGIPADIRSLIL